MIISLTVMKILFILFLCSALVKMYASLFLFHKPHISSKMKCLGNLLILNLFMIKMTVSLHMLCSFVRIRMRGNINCGLVVKLLLYRHFTPIHI